MSSNQDNPIVQAFVFETETMLEQIEQILLECEEEKEFNEENVNEIFRIMHTIKGGAAVCEFNNLSELAHSMEDMFFYIREQKPEIEDISIVTDVILEGVDSMNNYIEGIKSDEYEDIEVDDLMKKIHITIDKIKGNIDSEKENLKQREEALNKIDVIDLDDNNDKAIEDSKDNNEENDIYQEIDADDVLDLPDNIFECFELHLTYMEDCEMENLRAFQAVQEYEANVKAIKYYPEDLFAEDSKSINDIIRKEGFKIHIITEWSYSEIEESIGRLAFVEKAAINKIQKNDFGVFKHVDIKGKKIVQDKKKENLSHGQEQKRINVSVEKLDMLMDLVGELVLSESMVVSNPDLKGMKLDNFAKAARQHRKIIGELQDTVMSIRMMPLSTTFSKMKRIVRDVSKKLDREMQFEVIGEETEVDKNIIEQISDPLMHLVRNAADHGIESKEERKEKGKEEEGKIILEACHAGGDVLIKVIDNGRGLDKEKILEKALSNGLISDSEEDLTDKQIYSMIFSPGFSTNDKVTEFSGRGVGMDVVKTNVESLGGSIYVDSEKEQGTTVTLKIPLTLAIVSGMIISVGNAKYTVPIMSIRESFRPNNEDIIVDTEGNEMVMVRGECYIIRRLNKMYGVENAVENLEEGILIMIEDNEDTFCIFADEIIGEQQVVVKPLPEYVKRFNSIHGISGCTLLGDGDISLILDVGTLNQ